MHVIATLGDRRFSGKGNTTPGMHCCPTELVVAFKACCFRHAIRGILHARYRARFWASFAQSGSRVRTRRHLKKRQQLNTVQNLVGTGNAAGCGVVTYRCISPKTEVNGTPPLQVGGRVVFATRSQPPERCVPPRCSFLLRYFLCAAFVPLRQEWRGRGEWPVCS